MKRVPVVALFREILALSQELRLENNAIDKIWISSVPIQIYVQGCDTTCRLWHCLWAIFFSFSFAYTTSPAAVMKCLLHLWRTCSVDWSSSPQGHVGEGTIFSFLCMCALSLLWPERSRAKTTWPGLSRRLYASISCLGFSAVLMTVVFSWYWMLVDGCYSCAPDLVACCQRFRSVLGSIGEPLCMCCRVLAFVLLGGETCLFGELLIPIMYHWGRLLGSMVLRSP